MDITISDLCKRHINIQLTQTGAKLETSFWQIQLFVLQLLVTMQMCFFWKKLFIYENTENSFELHPTSFP